MMNLYIANSLQFVSIVSSARITSKERDEQQNIETTKKKKMNRAAIEMKFAYLIQFDSRNTS